MTVFKRPVYVIVDPEDLFDILDEGLCSFLTSFKDLKVGCVDKQADGSWRLFLDRKPAQKAAQK